MTAQERIDANVELLLGQIGSCLAYYNESARDRMRDAMRKVMIESYIQGSNDCGRATRRARNML